MLLKALSRGVAALIVLVLVVVTTVYLRSNSILHRTFHVQVKQPTVPTDAASISAGLHVATTRGCRNCHGPDLSGAVFINNPAMGVIAEAMVALVMANAFVEKFGGDSLGEIRRNYTTYLDHIAHRLG